MLTMGPSPACEPAPVGPVTIPTPEELGVASARTATADTDWLPGYRRLVELGACSFRIDRLAGGCHIICLLPSGQAQVVHRIESQGPTEAEAVRLAVEEAERCSGLPRR
jgi:hypothetical protein